MEEIEIKPTIPLTDQEVEMLDMLIRSPVWTVFKKVVSNGTAQWASSLAVSENFHEMMRLQGRIQGANYMVAFPPMLLKAKHDQKVKAFPKKAASNPPTNSPTPA